MLNIDLSGKVALVSGASRGIGFSIACKLVEAGADVVINARNIDESVIAKLEGIRAGSVTAIEGSIDDPEFVKSLVKFVFSKHKRLDILVNNAGIMLPGLMGMIPDADIDKTLNVNLGSVLHMTQAATRLMARGGGGTIINLTSIVGRRGEKGQFVYSASKAGVIGATLASSKELADRNIRVNAIAPGYIETDMTKNLGDDVREETLSTIALGRAGQPEDIANMVVFLASDMSSYVTGQVIGVDGGMVL